MASLVVAVKMVGDAGNLVSAANTAAKSLSGLEGVAKNTGGAFGTMGKAISTGSGFAAGLGQGTTTQQAADQLATMQQEMIGQAARQFAEAQARIFSEQLQAASVLSVVGQIPSVTEVAAQFLSTSAIADNLTITTQTERPKE